MDGAEHAPASTRARARAEAWDARAWSDADVLTVTDAARRLRAARSAVEPWLREIGALRDLPFGVRVVWGTVVRRLQEGDVVPLRPDLRQVNLPAGIVPKPVRR